MNNSISIISRRGTKVYRKRSLAESQRRKDEKYSYRGLLNIQKKHDFYQKFKLSTIYYISSFLSVSASLRDVFGKMLLIFFFTTIILACSGRTVTISGAVNRIVSTAPSNTEIIADLGMADKLVAIDRHSANVIAPDGYPEIPEGLPLLDFFYPDAELLINLQPDIIIASGHNPTGSGNDPFRLLSEAGVPVVYISMSCSIEEIYNDIALIAGLLQVQEKGEELIASMKDEIQNIVSTLSILNSQFSTLPSIYFEISAAPQMMTFGNGSFIDDMISTAGGLNIFKNENWLVSPGAESIIERNPDIILTNVNYIADPITEIKNRPGFNHINAVKNNRIYLIDNDSSSRPSARIIFALRQMSNAINSD